MARESANMNSGPELAPNNTPLTSQEGQEVPQTRGTEVSNNSQRELSENDVFVARVEEIFHRKLDKLKRQEEGSFSGRRPIRHKGRRVDSEALEEVNRLIGTLWDTGPGENKNFWVLNCMVVAGARTIQEISANARSARNTTRKTQRDMEEAIQRREVQILKVRKRIGWLTCEVQIKTAQRRPTGRQRAIGRVIRCIYGRRTLPELKVILEAQKGVLRVKALQLRRARQSL